MPTPAEVVETYPIALYLSVIDINKRGLNGGGTDVTLPMKIYSIGTSVVNRYNQDPTDETLTATCNFLFAIMGKYWVQAQAIIGSGSAGSVATISNNQSFPIYITEADFTTATFYPNTSISGNNILIFYNQIPRYLLPDEFTVSAAGITIDMPGFDATTQEIDLVIEKVY